MKNPIKMMVLICCIYFNFYYASEKESFEEKKSSDIKKLLKDNINVLEKCISQNKKIDSNLENIQNDIEGLERNAKRLFEMYLDLKSKVEQLENLQKGIAKEGQEKALGKRKRNETLNQYPHKKIKNLTSPESLPQKKK